MSFLSSCIEFPVLFGMAVIWKLVHKTKFVKASEMDFETDVCHPEEERWIRMRQWGVRGKQALLLEGYSSDMSKE